MRYFQPSFDRAVGVAGGHASKKDWYDIKTRLD